MQKGKKRDGGTSIECRPRSGREGEKENGKKTKLSASQGGYAVPAENRGGRGELNSKEPPTIGMSRFWVSSRGRERTIVKKARTLAEQKQRKLSTEKKARARIVRRTGKRRQINSLWPGRSGKERNAIKSRRVRLSRPKLYLAKTGGG